MASPSPVPRFTDAVDSWATETTPAAGLLRVRAGLRRDDLFTVTLEHFQTDTADFADLLLPATTFLEHPDLYTSYGHFVLQWADPVVAPRGEARPNTWVFRELAQRLGLDDDTLAWSAEEVARDLLDSDHPWLEGITLERLQREKRVPLKLPDPFRPYAEGSHFPDGRIRFSPAPRQLERALGKGAHRF